MEYKGYNGTIAVDGDSLTITHSGLERETAGGLGLVAFLGLGCGPQRRMNVHLRNQSEARWRTRARHKRGRETASKGLHPLLPAVL